MPLCYREVLLMQKKVTLYTSPSKAAVKNKYKFDKRCAY